MNALTKLVRMAALTTLTTLTLGCVERTIKITTEPAGAEVFLNDELVGRTPAEVRFQWYGDYGVTVRKEGFETLRTNKVVNAPVYEWPVLDVFSELLLPMTFHDRHAWHFELAPQVLPTSEQLLQQANQLRAAARGELPPPAVPEPAAAGAQNQQTQ